MRLESGPYIAVEGAVADHWVRLLVMEEAFKSILPDHLDHHAYLLVS